MKKFGHDVSFEQARSQIGKGGDKLIPVFLSGQQRRDHGQDLDAWRSSHFRSRYLPLVRPTHTSLRQFYFRSVSGQEASMRGDAPITWLMFFTLAAGIVVAAGIFIAFLRSKHNRVVAANVLEGDARGTGPAPSGAGAEFAGILFVALVAMTLLTFGYRGNAGTAVTTGSNAIAEHNDPNTPKLYQPQNPAPDTRSAPTGSPTRTGPESGGHPEANPGR